MPKQRQFNGKLADPEFRYQRARKAAFARNSLRTHVRHVIEHAHELSPDDVETLRSLLPAPTEGGER